MRISKKTRTRLVVLNACMWFVSGVTALALLGGPRGVIETHLEPVGSELGGWVGLAMSAGGIRRDSLPDFAIAVESEVFRAATLLDREPATGADASSERWWFPATFQADGTSYAVEVQLLAADPIALESSNRSWRIRFRGKDRFRGMRELELSPADTQQHATELVVRDRATAIGLLAPPAGFASLRVNGSEARGIFWSEDDSPAMLDRLGYPKGEILKPGSTAAAIPAGLAGREDRPSVFSQYAPSVDPDGRDRVAEEKLERMIALTRDGNDADFLAQIPELLDIEKFLSWNSLQWIFANPDLAAESELSWYFDPVTGLFEPVVRDFVAASGGPSAGGYLRSTHSALLASRLLSSPIHRDRRNEILWDLVGRESETLAAASDAVLGSVLTELARTPGALLRFGTLRENAGFRRATRAALQERIASLSSALAASQVETTPLLSTNGGTPTLTLTLEPAGLATIELAEIRFELGDAAVSNRDAADVSISGPDGASTQREIVEPIVIGSSVALHPTVVSMDSVAPGDATAQRTWTVEMRLPFFSGDTWSRPESIRSIDVVYRNAVTGESLPPARLLTPDALTSRPEGDFHALFRSVDEVISASQLPLEDRGDVLVLPAGDHVLLQTLVVPRSHRLVFEPGVTLRLGADVSLISFRSIEAVGTPTHPIRILAIDPEQPWGSLAVTRALDVSRLAFVTVSGGSRATFQGIEFDGQLSFNASDVELIDSEVYGSQHADGLSVKRAEFSVDRTQFVGNESDGIDAEWSHGIVSESLFVDNGDDGIDLADSDVSIDDCSFHWMGDKSISAGERSHVAVAATRLSDSEIAIASKEDSRVDVRDSEFRRNRLGFSLYRSKPVFGGGSGSVTGGVFARNERDFAVEPGSNLELNRVYREAAPSMDELIGAVALRPVVTRSR